MHKQNHVSFILGFIVLFAIYHFPEFYPVFWVMAIFKIGFLVAAFLLARVQGWAGLGGYGLALKPGWAYHLALGVLAGIFFFALSFFVSIFLGYNTINSVGSITSLVSQLPMILLMTAVPSIAEDILTRGYLFGHLKSMKPRYWILLSSLVYVLNHIWRLDDGAAVLTYLFVLGLVLAYAVVITQSLWLAFGIHWGANIAFESINSLVQTTADGETGNWILAGAWALLLGLIFLIQNYRSNRSLRLAA